MPVIGGALPTVQVSVPVPTPVAQPRKPQAQAAPPQPVPQGAAPSLQPAPQGVGQNDQPMPGAPPMPEPLARAFILPWMPEAEGQPQQMKRRVRRYSFGQPVEMKAFHQMMHDNPEELTTPLVYADWLEEQGMPTVASVIREHTTNKQNPLERDVHQGGVPKRMAYEMNPGEFRCVGFGGGKRELAGTLAAIVLQHRSIVDPTKYFAWIAHPNEKDLVNHLKSLVAEGVTPSEETAKLYKVKPPKQMSRRGVPKRYMETGEALWKSIQQNPDDTTARAVFADWLEENAQHLATPIVLQRLRTNAPMWVGKAKSGKILAIPHPTKEIMAARAAKSPWGVPNGDLFHVSSRNRKGQPHTVRISGKMKTWKTRPDEFRVPWKFGLYQNGELTHNNIREWLTEDPTEEPPEGPAEPQQMRRLPKRRLKREGKARKYMETGEALLRSVHQNLYDETAPLVFADYLEENGHSGAAEVIRRGIENRKQARGAGQSYHTLKSYDLQPWTGFAVPKDAPIGLPHAYLPRFDTSRAPITVGVNVLFRTPLDPAFQKFATGPGAKMINRLRIAPKGIGISAEPHEAYRLFGKMYRENVPNAGKALAMLQRSFTPEELQPGRDTSGTGYGHQPQE